MQAVEMERGKGRIVIQVKRGKEERKHQNDLMFGQMWQYPTEGQNLEFLA